MPTNLNMESESKQPTVSVILPTHNRAHLLGRAIRSALDQTYQDFELIVIDDGSTDETEVVVSSFGDIGIQHLRHEQNRGAAAARNTGLQAARGEYIAFLDSDGEWLPQKLHRQIDVFRAASLEVGVVYSDLWVVSEGGERRYWHSPRIMPEDGIVFRRAIDYAVSGINMQVALIRKRCIQKTGPFDETLPRYIDLELFIRLSKHCFFQHIAEPLCNHHVTSGISSDRGLLVQARKLILDKYRDDIQRSRVSLARHLYGVGTALCQNGDLDGGRRYLLSAVRTNPLALRHVASALVWHLGEGVYHRASSVKGTIQTATRAISDRISPSTGSAQR
jgi:glycosyltransferase involved in cell wall biosynthesis